MTNTQKQNNEQLRRLMAERLWLHYYNQTLFEKGLISEKERNRIAIQIDTVKSPLPRHST